MNIHCDNGIAALNVSKELKPLFDTMRAGIKIKKVVCMSGTSFHDKPENDFIIEDFIATEYFVNDVSTSGGDKVETNKFDDENDVNHFFYMCWVRSFELYNYDFIELPDGRVEPVENLLSS